MERKHIPETENRLLILYTLQSVGPVTAMQLLQAMAESDTMNYITMQLNLNEMEQQGQLTTRAHPLGSLLEMTQDGAYTLAAFGHRIPGSRREVIDALAPEWKQRFRSEQESPAESIILPGGSMCIHLRLLDKAATLLDLLLYLPRGERMNLLPERWRASVQAIYSATLTMLTAAYDPAAPMPPATDDETVRQCGPQDWLLSLTDDPLQPGIHLLMSLPDEHLARCSALNWPAAAGKLRLFVLAALRSALP